MVVVALSLLASVPVKDVHRLLLFFDPLKLLWVGAGQNVFATLSCSLRSRQLGLPGCRVKDCMCVMPETADKCVRPMDRRTDGRR